MSCAFSISRVVQPAWIKLREREKVGTYGIGSGNRTGSAKHDVKRK